MSRTGVAWYDVKGGGWLRDIFVLLHPPYTLWHLSYVPIGAALAPELDWGLLGWTVLAFFLAMGIGGHFLDELNGRPLRTKTPAKVLWTIAGVSILAALAIGFLIGVRETMWVWPCMVFGALIVFAYNLEWPSKRMKQAPQADLLHTPLSHLPEGFFHRDEWFGIAWGAFPAITAYVAQTGALNIDIVLLAFACWGYSMAQRKLSMQARFWRRKVGHLAGDYAVRKPNNGYEWGKITIGTIIGPAEVTLKYLNVTILAIAAGLLATHLLKGAL